METFEPEPVSDPEPEHVISVPTEQPCPFPAASPAVK